MSTSGTIKISYLSNIFLIIILFINTSCDRRKDVAYYHEPGGFKFSTDLKMTPAELKADSALNSMRRELLSRKGFDWSLFTSFASNVGEIQNEKLYRVFKKMPKGGMLHVHSTAGGDAEWIVDKAISMSDCYLFWSNDSAQYLKGQLGFFPNHKIPAGFFPVQQVYSENPQLKTELYRLYTLGSEDEITSDIWVEFEKIFVRIGGFISYRPVFTEYFRNAFGAMAEDGVQFVEIRTGLGGVMNEDGTYTQDEALIDLYKAIITNVRTSYPFFDLAIIPNSKRSTSIENVSSQIQRITRLQSEYPEMIIGFDLNGEEDGQHSNGYFSSALKSSPVPLFLHAGESLSASNTNIQDALNLNASRIGHGLNLYYFPDLERTIISRGILIELCPISNQALRYVRDFRLNPALGYLQRGVQGTLGSDDPEIFQSTGLTDDYFVAYLSWGLDLRSVKKMLLNSITYSGMPVFTVQSQLSLFDKRWGEFVQYVNGQ